MKKVMTAIGIIALLTLLSIVYLGSQGVGRARDYSPKIEQAAHEFYELLNREEYTQIYYQMTDDKFQQVAPYDDFATLLYDAREKLGAVESREKGLWKINVTAGDTFYYVQYDVTRANAQSLETFIWKKDGDDWLVQGYNVNSPELLEDDSL